MACVPVVCVSWSCGPEATEVDRVEWVSDSSVDDWSMADSPAIDAATFGTDGLIRARVVSCDWLGIKATPALGHSEAMSLDVLVLTFGVPPSFKFPLSLESIVIAENYSVGCFGLVALVEVVLTYRLVD